MVYDPNYPEYYEKLKRGEIPVTELWGKRELNKRLLFGIILFLLVIITVFMYGALFAQAATAGVC